ncbi:MAG: hypothetical protein DRR16_03750 [Candidatus Parabeggiatoa sp. nov. 3]|nr:MAG: hypothetical protein DRR00_11995 [Gammaproteobacteria bacterium]RKZ67653.1 MAG: hypothetical protein DRQ99_06005 [Gammaproteobacteria bacterium]RKZ88948.1 MAG: hypothetical protein DRR16_03750 [Gammaproteobacteria bacterium]
MQNCGVSLAIFFHPFNLSRFKLRSVLKVRTSINYLNLKLRSILTLAWAHFKKKRHQDKS